MKYFFIFILGVILLSVALICKTTLAVEKRKAKASDMTNVKDSDENMVRNCIFLGTVTGRSGWGGLASSIGLDRSKKSVIKKAGKLGATNVVFVNVSGGWAPSAQARAYNCSETR